MPQSLKAVVTKEELIRYLANRLINYLLAEGAYWLSYVGVRWINHMPTFVSIEPADYCQLRCPECPVGNSSKRDVYGVMDLELYSKVLLQCKRYVHTIQFFFQGEPLLNPRLPEMVEMAHKEGIYTIISTNAQALTREMANRLTKGGLDRIIVSMDGASQATYEIYRRGGRIEKVWDGLRFLSEAKRTYKSKMVVELQCLCLKSNEHEWSELKHRYREWGADTLTLKTAQLYDYENGNDLMPVNEHYSRYMKGADGKYHLRRQWWKKRLCKRVFMGCVVDVQGNVLPCCFDKNREYVYGNLRTATLRDCWEGERAQRFREQVVRHRNEIQICQNCTE